MTTTSPRLNDFVPLVCHCFFNDTATTEIYTLSLHDALPIWGPPGGPVGRVALAGRPLRPHSGRSEEHTSELQSHLNLVCRLLLEKNKKYQKPLHYTNTTRTHLKREGAACCTTALAVCNTHFTSLLCYQLAVVCSFLLF